MHAENLGETSKSFENFSISRNRSLSFALWREKPRPFGRSNPAANSAVRDLLGLTKLREIHFAGMDGLTLYRSK